jgi:hypothetical protein
MYIVRSDNMIAHRVYLPKNISMKIKFALIVALLSTSVAYAQSDSLMLPPPPEAPDAPPIEEPFDYTPWSMEGEKEDEDPNIKDVLLTTYIGVGGILPFDQNDSLQLGNKLSTTFSLGYRKKYRFNNHFGAGFGLSYTNENYHLKQDSANLLTGATTYDKLDLQLDKFGFEPFVRVIFNNPNGTKGTYLDLGGQINWVMGRRMYYYDKVDPLTNAGAKIIESTSRRLDYINQWDAFATARINFNWFGISAKYRVTDMFKASKSVNNNVVLPQLSPLQVGIEICW